MTHFNPERDILMSMLKTCYGRGIFVVLPLSRPQRTYTPVSGCILLSISTFVLFQFTTLDPNIAFEIRQNIDVFCSSSEAKSRNNAFPAKGLQRGLPPQPPVCVRCTWYARGDGYSHAESNRDISLFLALPHSEEAVSHKLSNSASFKNKHGVAKILIRSLVKEPRQFLSAGGPTPKQTVILILRSILYAPQNGSVFILPGPHRPLR